MDKKWKLTIGIEHYYLTDAEKDFYISSINKGAKYVAINDKTLLGTNFQTLVHEEVMRESSNIEQGKWKCANGTWHTEGWPCTCNEDLVFDEKNQRYISNKRGSEMQYYENK